jgi:hypothetical protein
MIRHGRYGCAGFGVACWFGKKKSVLTTATFLLGCKRIVGLGGKLNTAALLGDTGATEIPQREVEDAWEVWV